MEEEKKSGSTSKKQKHALINLETTAGSQSSTPTTHFDQIHQETKWSILKWFERVMDKYLQVSQRMHGKLVILNDASSTNVAQLQDKSKCSACHSVPKINYGYVLLYLLTSFWMLCNIYWTFADEDYFDLYYSLTMILFLALSINYIVLLHTKTKHKYAFQVFKKLLQTNKLWDSKKHNQNVKIACYLYFSVILMFQFVLLPALGVQIVIWFFQYEWWRDVDRVLLICSCLSLFLWFCQIFPAYITLVTLLWYRQLVCKQILVDLIDKETELTQLAQNINMNSLKKNYNVYEWYNHVYKPLSDKMQSEAELKWFKASYFCMILALFLQFWYGLSWLLKLLTYSSIYVSSVLYLSCVGIIVLTGGFLLIYFLCEQTKHYHKIEKTINKILVRCESKSTSVMHIRMGNAYDSNSNYDLNTDKIWLDGIRCRTAIQVNSITGSIFGYEISWVKFFRLTIVFAFTKILFFGLAADYNGWDTI